MRIVIDWRDDTALVCEVATPSAALARLELDILDEHFGPHRRFPPLRTAGRSMLWSAAGGAVWLSSMREAQSTPAAHAVAVATYLAVLGGLALLVAHVARRALPPRRVAPQRFRAAHLRTTIGWSWLAPATVFLLRVPRDPYVEWALGYRLALAAAALYSLACLPRRFAPRRAQVTGPRPEDDWRDVPRESFTPGLRPGLEPERVVAPVEGGALAAYWRTPRRVEVDEPRWNLQEHAWPCDIGEVTAQLYDTWDGAPLRVVVARAHDRTVMVRSHDSRPPLDRARELTDTLFGSSRVVAEVAFEPRWTAAVLVAWLCALTFAVGSDLGPSTYVWLWPVDFRVDHDYPVLAAASAAAVVLAWGWTTMSLARLFTRDLPRRRFRRAARLLAWQVVAVWLGIEILTLTLMPRLTGVGAAAAGWVVAVVNAVVVLVALGVVLVIRPESPLGVTAGRRGEIPGDPSS